ncbi:MAG: threonine/serine exporter family protein [Bacteroidaceae bacterium]
MIKQTETKQEILLLRRKLDLLLRTGELLVESAADTNRIMRNMLRVAAYLGLPEENLHIDVSYTMLSVNLSDNSHSYSKYQKCEHHNIDMTVLSAVSKLSWRAIREDYSLEKYEQELERIKNKPRNYVPMVVAIGAGFACGGFCKLFGCDWIAFLFTSICAFIGFRSRAYCLKFGINLYMSIAISSFIATCLSYLTIYTGWSATPYHPLLACALFIVPGVPLINFVDDMIDNYLTLGITRAANTIMILGAMTLGIYFALQIFKIHDINIDKQFSELSMVPHDPYSIYAIAAAIAAIGFSIIFNIPRRLLWVVALGGIIAVCTRNFVNFELGYGPIIGSFAGSLVVSLIAVRAVHWFHVPNHLLTIPSVIPMIPGVLMYRSFIALVNMHGVVGELTEAFFNGIHSALIIFFISLGVVIPDILARRYIAKDRQKALLKELELRKERGKFIEW